MVQLPTVSEASTCDAFVETPLDDYELVDFGHGRKLERWGPYLVEHPDKLATGEPRDRQWQADWVYVAEVGQQGRWEPTRSGLAREWKISLNGQPLHCRLDSRGRVGLHGRDWICGEWVRQRIEGCYDLEDLRVLNLFAGFCVKLTLNL